MKVDLRHHPKNVINVDASESESESSYQDSLRESDADFSKKDV